MECASLLIPKKIKKYGVFIVTYFPSVVLQISEFYIYKKINALLTRRIIFPKRSLLT